ncbi:Panacea domain-containing protein [Azospirillum sp. sgz302134]
MPSASRSRNNHQDLARLKALVHYVCDSFSDYPAKLGKVKLQKILWNADRVAYLKLGTTISGASYVKMPEGPATPYLDIALEELESEKKIKVRTTENGPFIQYMFLSLEEASDRLLSKRQIRIIDFWIRYAEDKTAKQLSKESHNLTWEVYEMGEEIDMDSSLLPSLQEVDSSSLMKSIKRFSRAVTTEKG